MVNITGRIAKLVVVIVYPIVFGLVELVGKLDQVVRGELGLLDAFKQAFLELLDNGFKNAPALLGIAVEQFETNNPIMGMLRITQFFMFIILLAVLLSFPAFGLTVLGLNLGFLGLIFWSTMNTFLISMVLNNQFPAILGFESWFVGMIIIIFANIGFLMIVYFWQNRSEK